jgi:hypothetical protein
VILRRLLSRRALRSVLGPLVLAPLALAAVPGTALAATKLSTNWAGYVVSPRHARAFTSVSGTWTVPATTCTSGQSGYSAVWVGLGGYRQSSKRLEQVGSESDCDSRGRPVYAAWWEIVPAAPVSIQIGVHPGDTVSASATVAGHAVTLRLRDLTSGKRFSTTRRVSATDASTADWIVEAPSVCQSSGSCSTLALADFGTAAFASATATTAAGTAAAGDPGWNLTAVELVQEGAASAAAGRGARHAPARSVTTAVPSALAPGTGAFTVTRSQQGAEAAAPPAPTLPGFGGEGS